MITYNTDELATAIADELGKHNQTRGMAVAMGTTCACGFWEKGRGRRAGSDGLDSHRAEVVMQLLEDRGVAVVDREDIAVATAALGRLQDPKEVGRMIRLQVVAGLPTIDSQPVTPGSSVADRLRDNVVAVSLPNVDGEGRIETSGHQVQVTPRGMVKWVTGFGEEEETPEAIIALGLAMVAAGSVGKAMRA